MNNPIFTLGFRAGSTSRWWIVSLLAIWMTAVISVCAGENLIRNGELDGGSSKGVPEWNFKSAYTDAFKNGWNRNADGEGGVVFIKCIGPDEKGGNEWWWQEMVCEPEQEYQLSVEARSEGNEHKADIGVEFIGGAKNYEYKRIATVADTQSNVPRKIVTPDWKEFSSKFTVPPGVTKVKVRLGMMAKDVAEVSYRNVRLEKR